MSAGHSAHPQDPVVRIVRCAEDQFVYFFHNPLRDSNITPMMRIVNILKYSAQKRIIGTAFRCLMRCVVVIENVSLEL